MGILDFDAGSRQVPLNRSHRQFSNHSPPYQRQMSTTTINEGGHPSEPTAKDEALVDDGRVVVWDITVVEEMMKGMLATGGKGGRVRRVNMLQCNTRARSQHDSSSRRLVWGGMSDFLCDS